MIFMLVFGLYVTTIDFAALTFNLSESWQIDATVHGMVFIIMKTLNIDDLQH